LAVTPASATCTHTEDITIPAAVKKIGAVIGVCAALLDRRAYTKRSATKIAAVVIPILALSYGGRARLILPTILPNPHNERPSTLRRLSQRCWIAPTKGLIA
jgi:hypothetical protein